MSASPEESARAAAQALISAFASHDRERYFSSFTPDASFIFHNVPQMLDSRAAYEALWTQWEQEGFRVRSCVSEDSELRMLSDDIALFKHRVTTHLDGVPEPSLERETIVLQRQAGGNWLAVHEHLSPLPREAS
jgi:uncharacterized protein (TIGR02246 family)